MLSIYWKGKSTTEAQAIYALCTVYGEDAVAESAARKCFTRFKDGDFNLGYQQRSSRSSTTDED